VTKQEANNAKITFVGGTISMVGNRVPTTDKGWSILALSANFAGPITFTDVTIKNETENSFISNFTNTATTSTIKVDASGNTFVDANGEVITDAKDIAEDILNLKNGNIAVDYSSFKDANGDVVGESADAILQNGKNILTYTEDNVSYMFVDGVAVDCSTIFVDSSYAGSTGTDLGAGKYFGFNAFADLKSAIGSFGSYDTANQGTLREIVVSGEVKSNTTGKLFFYSNSDVVISAAEGTTAVIDASSNSRFYLRLQVKDTPGVIAAITQILADRGISISCLIQHEGQSSKSDSVSLVILTHPVKERNMRAALSELGVLSINSSPVKLLRIEDI
jgi:hypothetical protein